MPVAAPAQSPGASVLNSWKEIAAYLGRGVRTVQRYERELNLPIRRPRGTSRSAVIALKDDLDAWLRIAPCRQTRRLPSAALPTAALGVDQAFVGDAALRQQCNALRAAHAEVMANVISSINGLVETIDVVSSRIRSMGLVRGAERPM